MPLDFFGMILYYWVRSLPMETNGRNELEKLTEKLMENNHDIEILNKRSKVYCRMREWENALKDIKKILEIDPKNEEAASFLPKIKYQIELEAKITAGIPIDFSEAYRNGALAIPVSSILSRMGPAIIDYGNGNVVFQPGPKET
jgi:tetratricopeptide (TPR) repeat protein